MQKNKTYSKTAKIDYATKPSTLLSKLRDSLKGGSWKLPVLAIFYVLAYVLFDLAVDSIVRQYIFCIVLVVSSLYFSWRIGGRETMTYVGFFNIFFAFIFF